MCVTENATYVILKAFADKPQHKGGKAQQSFSGIFKMR